MRKTLKEVKKIAKDRGLKPKRTIAGNIWQIQEEEGNNPCFSTSKMFGCILNGCSWFGNCKNATR